MTNDPNLGIVRLFEGEAKPANDTDPWGGYDKNPYYSPEKCGLAIVDSLDNDEAYEFHIFLVVRDLATGDLYIGEDSGCSCPTPFEDFRGLSDMTQVRSMEQLDQELESRASSYSPWKLGDVLALRRKVQAAFNPAPVEDGCFCAPDSDCERGCFDR